MKTVPAIMSCFDFISHKKKFDFSPCKISKHLRVIELDFLPTFLCSDDLADVE
jgi:hypothetical protein